MNANKMISILVSFEKPEYAKDADCLQYVADAVETWRGQCRPPFWDDVDPIGDPMFSLDSETVQVKKIAPNAGLLNRKKK